jgi:hypothetical protein
VIALVATILVFTVPGLPVALAAWKRAPGVPALVWLASVPLIAIVVNFMAVTFAPVGRITRSFDIAVLAVAAAASVAVAWFVPSTRPRLRVRRPDLPTTLRYAAIPAGIVVGSIAWMSAFPQLDQPPPNYDSAAHGFMTTRIIESASTAPGDVVLSGPEGLASSGAYYPLGVHASAAMAVTLGDVPVASVLNIITLLFAAGLFPLAAFVIVDGLTPEFRFAAPLAALASVGIEAFPYKPIAWGGIPLIVGNVGAFVVAAVMVAVVRGAARSWPAALGVGCAVAGLWHVHNSEVVLAAALVSLMLTLDLPVSPAGNAIRIARDWFRDSWAMLWRGGLVTGLLLLFLVPQFVRGGSERSSFDDVPLGDPLVALGQIVFMQAGLHRQGSLLVIGVIGMAVLIRRRKYAVPIAFALVIFGAYWTATTDNPVSTALTFPWWRQPERMIYVVSMLASLGFAVAVGAAIEFVMQRRAVSVLLRAPIAFVVAAAACAAVLLPGAQAGRTMVYRAFKYYSPVTDESRAGFDVAAALAGPDGTVLTDWNRDAALWMYAFDRVEVVRALEIVDPGDTTSNIERTRLVNELPSIGTDTTYDELVAKYRVRAVYFDERTYEGSAHTYTRDTLRQLSALREVYDEGTVSVFEIVLPATS